MQLNFQRPNRRWRVSRHKKADCDVGHVTSYECIFQIKKTKINFTISHPL